MFPVVLESTDDRRSEAFGTTHTFDTRTNCFTIAVENREPNV